jgi:two-component system sensor histidine kinase SenX3
VSLGVVVMTHRGEVTYRNQRANAMAGTHTGLLIDDAVDEALQRARRGEHVRRLVQLYGPPQVAVVVAAEPLPDGAAVATIEDVSERRRLDAVRTDFVANISHELKTPVGALAVLAEALAEEDDPAVVHRVADRMVNEAHRVARTIDDLMELSRIELGEEPVRDTVAVSDVVAGAIERADGLAESRGIQIAVLDRSDDIQVVGDRRQLISALGNLVENAVKYSGDGSKVQIRVRVDGAFAELMVADQGIGIPAADHDRIFERFYRVDKARGRDTGGTGLGLSIVRHVATSHRGEVLVSSQEGEGSTFVLRLPLDGTAGPSADPASAPSTTRSPT